MQFYIFALAISNYIHALDPHAYQDSKPVQIIQKIWPISFLAILFVKMIIFAI